MLQPKYRKKSVTKRFEEYLIRNGIEFRRGTSGGGNQARQPYIQKYISKNYYKKLKITEIVHFFGYYIGNYPSLNKKKIVKFAKY